MADIRAQTFPILFAAAIYAALGWLLLSWSHQYANPTASQPQPQLLYMVVMLKWTLRGGAIAFAVAGMLALRGTVLGPLLYGIVGVLAALSLATVAVWDLNSQYYSGLHPALLLLLAAWHGYGSVTGLYELRTSIRRPPAMSAEESGLTADR